ncbi:MAG: NADH-quinone oxidoreductase subunit NuoE [Pseudomonadota bacterium]|jgi:NADH-quinone oxidoreductase E subunit|nr:NADH-quinone oxidoreductase subunit NuoE [Alphaproteobacteria bacterium]MDP5012128.1 NADH-quinone oxidoreductase subunit NuoE [Alphaproteobacteria bacterium]MDP5370504.1 NADH-quinone oxidoreductase subunit NuoE [Pseudomonadota bacterium]
MTFLMNSFSFSVDSLAKIDTILTHYPAERKASAVLPLLDLAQRESGGWLPTPAMEAVATMLDMPFIKVYEVATFYTMFNLKPVGKYHLQVCGTTPCWLRGAEDIMNTCKKHLGIQKGATTDDGLFTLSEVECLGACVNAPVVQINDDYFEDLTPEKMVEVLDDLKAGKAIHKGSQIGRQCSQAVQAKLETPVAVITTQNKQEAESC